MMKSPSKKLLPGWQIERQQILQRACKSIQFRRAKGEQLKTILPRVARRYRNKPFKSAPHKRLALSPATLRYLWHAWKRSGEIPAAFKLNFVTPRPRVPGSLLVRFVDFAAARSFPSMKAAWQEFAARPVNRVKAGRVSYQQLLYSFPGADFRALQAELAAIQAAQIKLARLRLAFIAGIRNRMPDEMRKPLVKPGADFQI